MQSALWVSEARIRVIFASSRISAGISATTRSTLEGWGAGTFRSSCSSSTLGTLNLAYSCRSCLRILLAHAEVHAVQYLEHGVMRPTSARNLRAYRALQRHNFLKPLGPASGYRNNTFPGRSFSAVSSREGSYSGCRFSISRPYNSSSYMRSCPSPRLDRRRPW